MPLLVQYRQASASSKSKVRKLISELPKQALGVDGKPLPSLPPFEPESTSPIATHFHITMLITASFVQRSPRDEDLGRPQTTAKTRHGRKH